MLHLESELDASATFPVTFSKLMTGEYVLPYRGDNLRDLLTNGVSYLEFRAPPTMNRIFFKEVREVFYGEMKGFLVCTHSTIEVVPLALEENNG